MNRPIRLLAVGCLVLFLALFARATYVQYVRSGSLDDVGVHENNIRVLNAEYSRNRGAITVGGNPIAVSKKSGDRYKYQRTYPHGREYADITGFYSRDWGLGGLESAQNTLLSGDDNSLFLTRIVDLLDDRPEKGGQVVTTLNARAQAAAYNGLKGKIGAVVAIQPTTGAILAMASSPTYDPNRLATHDFGKVGPYKNKLLARKPSPLDNIGIETVVPPGSTFKIVTTSAALSSGRFTPSSLVPGASSMKLPLSTHVLHNENDFACGAGKVTLTVALEKSCNVAYGTVGEKLGIKRLSSQAKKFGFSEERGGVVHNPDIYFTDLDDPLNHQAASRFPADADAPHTVLAAIGQGDVAATPLQMAMVAAGIANNGTVMKPYLVSETDSPDLDVLSKASPKPLPGQPAVSPGVAREVRQMMIDVVADGTGTQAQIPGVPVAGKTGTAQSEASRPPYAWFVSFAPATNNPQVAVAVLIQDAGVERDQISGGGLAAPIAKAVMEAVIGK